MTIGKDKTRILVTIPIEVKDKLESLAEYDDRSLSNYCAKVLRKHVLKNSDNDLK